MSTVSPLDLQPKADREELVFVMAPDTRHELEEIIQGYDNSLDGILDPMAHHLSRNGRWPWAIVFFRSEFALAGHVAETRALKSRMPMSCYSPVPLFDINSPEEVPPVSILYVPSKKILREHAAKSPLFSPAWEALKNAAHNRRWVCISDSPHPAWVQQTTVDNGDRYMRARAKERELAEAPGYESLHIAEEYMMAMSAYSEGSTVELLTHANRMVAQFPNRPGAHLVMGVALSAGGDIPGAMEEYRAAIVLERTRARAMADGWRNRAQEWMDEDCLEKDVCLLKADHITSESKSDAATAWLYLAGSHYRSGDLEAARLACEEGLQSFPDYYPLHLNHFEFCDMMGDVDAGLSSAFNAVKHEPENGYPLYRLGQFLWKTGKKAEAIRCFEKAAELAPGVEFAPTILGTIHTNSGDYEKGVKWCRVAVAAAEEEAEAWNVLSVCSRGLGLVEDSIDAGRRAMRLKPDENSWDTLGAAYSAAGRPNPAIKCLLRALSLDWQHGEAWYDLGLTYLRNGDRAKAESVVQQLQQIDLVWTAMLRDELDGK